MVMKRCKVCEQEKEDKKFPKRSKKCYACVHTEPDNSEIEQLMESCWVVRSAELRANNGLPDRQ